MISERIRAALAAAKAKGTKLGGYRGTARTAKAREGGSKVRTARAISRATDSSPYHPNATGERRNDVAGHCSGVEHAWHPGGRERGRLRKSQGCWRGIRKTPFGLIVCSDSTSTDAKRNSSSDSSAKSVSGLCSRWTISSRGISHAMSFRYVATSPFRRRSIASTLCSAKSVATISRKVSVSLFFAPFGRPPPLFPVKNLPCSSRSVRAGNCDADIIWRRRLTRTCHPFRRRVASLSATTVSHNRFRITPPSCGCPPSLFLGRGRSEMSLLLR